MNSPYPPNVYIWRGQLLYVRSISTEFKFVSKVLPPENQMCISTMPVLIDLILEKTMKNETLTEKELYECLIRIFCGRGIINLGLLSFAAPFLVINSTPVYKNGFFAYVDRTTGQENLFPHSENSCSIL
jgi:hypothetical protein